MDMPDINAKRIVVAKWQVVLPEEIEGIQIFVYITQ